MKATVFVENGQTGNGNKDGAPAGKKGCCGGTKPDCKGCPRCGGGGITLFDCFPWI